MNVVGATGGLDEVYNGASPNEAERCKEFEPLSAGGRSVQLVASRDAIHNPRTASLELKGHKRYRMSMGSLKVFEEPSTPLTSYDEQ